MMNQIQYTCWICIYNIHLQSIQYYLGTHQLPKLRVSDPHLSSQREKQSAQKTLGQQTLRWVHMYILCGIQHCYFFYLVEYVSHCTGTKCLVSLYYMLYNASKCVVSASMYLIHNQHFTFFSQLFPKILKYQYDVSNSDDIKINNYC